MLFNNMSDKLLGLREEMAKQVRCGVHIKNMQRSPKVILFDIENCPNLGYTWGKYEQNVIAFTKNWYMLSFSYKILGQKKIHTFALPDFPGYKKNKEADFNLVRKLWEVLNDADLVVAHNGNNFDIKKANARFLYHGLPPPSPFKQVDTLLWARRYFQFESNKLDDLGMYFKVGHKLPHTGFHLWRGCMEGDMRSWALMKRYNAQDVRLLEKVYLRMRPWANHPNLRIFDRKEGCPSCGSLRLQSRGVHHLKNHDAQRVVCVECGKWFTGKIIKHDKSRISQTHRADVPAQLGNNQAKERRLLRRRQPVG